MSIFNNNKLDPFGTNSLFADINNTNQQINSMNLPAFAKEEEEKKRKKAEQMMKLQNLADTFNMVNAQKSGNAQGVALYYNRIKQRQFRWCRRRCRLTGTTWVSKQCCVLLERR